MAVSDTAPPKRKSFGRRLMIGFLVFAALCAACVTWFMYEYPVYYFKYKTTLEIMTPEGLVQGSSVINLQMNYSILNWVNNTIDGEGIFIAMPGGRNLVVSLGGAPATHPINSVPTDHLAMRMFEFSADKSKTWTALQRAKLGEKKSVPLDLMPMIVLYRNPLDPKTAELVDPADLSKTYGAGTSVVAFTVEKTDEPVSDTINTHLPWVDTYKVNFGITSSSDPFSEVLSGRYFKRHAYWH